MHARRAQRLMSNQIIIRKKQRRGKRARLWIQDAQVNLWSNSEEETFWTLEWPLASHRRQIRYLKVWIYTLASLKYSQHVCVIVAVL